MSNLIIKKLYIFELESRTAKRVDFTMGINVVTSDKKNKNDVGKSILLKSLYHTLGADSIFDDSWEEKPKIYIIQIEINQNNYFVYRSGKMFKIYSNDFNKLFETINRAELSEYLKVLYGFSVKLPNREEDELEISPPVFSYILNYVDQDYLNGSKFSSFNALQHYANSKMNIIYSHFGIFTEEYFHSMKELEKLRREDKSFSEEKLIIESMLKRVKEYLDGIDSPPDIETLNVELHKSKKEYTDITLNLKKIKNNLIKLRNEKIDLEDNIKEMQKLQKSKEKEVKLINKSVCPTCSQNLEEVAPKISMNSQLEDFYIFKDHLDGLVLEVNRKIELKESHYKNFLQRLGEFEKGIENNSKNNISDILKHRGYLETQDNMIKEFGVVNNKIRITSESIKEQQKTLDKYNEKKQTANDLYNKYMVDAINKFGLKEIKLDRVKKIRNNIPSRGSNIPIATIIWYFNLLKVKYVLNSNSIKFPLVLDSPNNAELDDDKRLALFNYIFTNNNEETQLILSTLGFDKNDYKDIEVKNIVELENEKYSLLNEKDYIKNKDILESIFNN
ncbi:hypothetical protein ACFVSS_17385 [Peribacillus butanolivorans]|uniref:hypothetical protein n=1 Tax=Peribacillus butanolivorans TaxID=421767 RepID=UPI0036DF98CE